MAGFPDIRIDGDHVERLIMDLGMIGAYGDTGVWRTAYSPEWVRANDLFRDWSRAAGLAVRTDEAGNCWARLEGAASGKSIVSGSHIDTQRPGGRYDGALGIIAAFVAVKALKEQFGQPRRTLEVVSLCEEEGSRFPSAGFWGSRAITGSIGANETTTVTDFEGKPIADAMRAIGLDPAALAKAQRDDIEVFIELHIEQGPVLEHAGRSAAIVDAITGIRHTRVKLIGVQNHAGAFPMDLRTDPMAGFAEIASGLIDTAHRMGRPAVTTIGTCTVDPGGAAVIPRSVEFVIDARHPDPAAYKTLHETHERFVREVAARRRLEVEFKIMLDKEPCPCAPEVLRILDRVARHQGLDAMTMASGAGHDSQQMAKRSKVAMVFVRSKDGRSHTPEEFSSIPDIVDGIRLLAGALHELAY
ncbi:MAG: hydantoinase/carbamoylase family amidase [Parvibaculaceae bacterium]